MSKIRYLLICITVVCWQQEAFCQAVNYSALFGTDDFDSRQINISLPVGATAGTAGNSSSGAGTYTIPIACPPGTRGIKPEITINYSSMGANGIAGQGWNLTGLSSVVRSSKDQYHDGKNAGVQHNMDDVFSLDGLRLVGITGSYGADGSVYAKEAEDFSCITSFGATGNGPERFLVWCKNGTYMEYGGTAESRFLTDLPGGTQSVMIWRLNRVYDADGNTMSYVYDNSERDSRLIEISYTSNPSKGLVAYNKIHFEYSQRLEQNKIFSGGASIAQRYLLEKIVITGDGGQAYKTYAFRYGTDQIVSYLKEVQEFGTNGVPLNSTVFRYGEAGTEIEMKETNINVPFFADAQDANGFDLFSGDYNGDGKSEIVTAKFKQGPNPNTPRIYENYTIYRATGQDRYIADPMKTLPVQTVVEHSFTPFAMVSADYDGDGIDDILTYKASVINSRNMLDSVALHQYPPGGTQSNQRSWSPQSYVGCSDGVLACGIYSGTGNEGNYIFSGDFDGDGRTDVLTILNNSCQNLCGIWAFLSFPAKNSYNNRVKFPINSSSTGAGLYIQGAQRVFVVDFDGDGKSELMAVRDDKTRIFTFAYVPGSNDSGTGYYGQYDYKAVQLYESGYPTRYDDIWVGDFNGDRKTDVLTHNNSNAGNFTIGYSTGTGIAQVTMDFKDEYLFNCLQTGQGQATAALLDRIYVADFNGDGKADILHVQPGCGDEATNKTSRLNIYYARGYNSFFYETHTVDKRISNWDITPLLSDVDGDGRTDLTFYPVKSTGNLMTIYFRQSGQEHLLRGIRNGFNHTIRLNYTLASQNSQVFKRGSYGSYPINGIKPAIWVIESIEKPNGVGGEDVTTYQYEQADYHRAGRGFLGFRKITSSNKTANVKTVQQYGLDEPFFVPFLQSTASYLLTTNAPIAKTGFYNTLASLGGCRFFLKQDSIVNQDLLSGGESRTVNVYDQWGNVVQNNVSIKGTHDTRTETVYVGNNSTPVPSLAGRVKVSHKRSQQPEVSRSVSYNYNPMGKLTMKQDELLNVTSNYAYDAFGNLISEQTSASGVSYTINQSYSWDGKGRFQASATNTLGQTSYSTYHPLWGTLTAVQGIDGLQTAFLFDAFGNLQQTDYITQGYAVKQNRGWDVNGLLMWYQKTEHPGRPDITIWYDQLNREIRKQQEHFNNSFVNAYTQYDERGNVASFTNNHTTGETPFITTNYYDGYNRMQSSATNFGTTIYDYVYSQGNVTIRTTTPSGQKSLVTKDQNGMVTASEDGAGSLSFSYNSWGNQIAVKQSGVSLVTTTYNNRGLQTGLKDINAGDTSYEYNVFGQLISETDANGSTHTMQYDALGRMTLRNGPEGTTSYTYYGAGNGLSNQIRSITDYNGFRVEYGYDPQGRLVSKQRFFQGQSPRIIFVYNTYGDLVQVQYPSGISIENSYDANGFLKRVKDLSGLATYFETLEMNGMGQYTKYKLVNGKITTKTFQFGLPETSSTPGIQNDVLGYDYSTFNITSRKDNLKGLTELFEYDQLNRLVSSKKQVARGMYANLVQMAYDLQGRSNIISKSDIGNYQYSSSKVHAVTFIDNTANAIDRTKQEFSWTAFMKADMISEGNFEEQFTYDEDYNRIKTVFKENGQPKWSWVYLDGCEWQEEYGGTFNYVTYIPGGDGISAMVVYENGANKVYAVYRDHLNSIVKLSDLSGNLIEQSFDAWGRRRNPNDWSYSNIPVTPKWLFRGFTGHELLKDFGLVNMNGRLYDPLIGKMISADNLVGRPLSGTGYNRYAYANNNPLSYTDPDGNNPVAMLAIYVAVYATTNLAIQASQNKVHSFGDGAKAFGIGALQGALAYVTAGCPAELGWQLFANAGLSVASSWMPPVTISLGSSATLSLSPTFGFGTGALGSVSAGFGIGARASLTVHNGDSAYSFSAGVNGYNDEWGVAHSEGVFSAGVNISKGNNSTSFFLSSWTGPTSQYSWQAGVKIGDFSYKFNNDAGFSDKYRTFSLEIGVGNFIVGSQVYTTVHDPTGAGHWISPIAGANKAGSYVDHGAGGNGHVLGSPSYIGWKDGNMVYRFGVNAPISQDFFQNSFHKLLGVPFFEKGTYLSPYVYTGTYNPYSLY